MGTQGINILSLMKKVEWVHSLITEIKGYKTLLNLSIIGFKLHIDWSETSLKTFFRNELPKKTGKSTSC